MREGSVLEVLLTFLKLGLTSFGGPVAHIGYFREEIVVRRGWVDDAAYTDLVALCQFLPGPAVNGGVKARHSGDGSRIWATSVNGPRRGGFQRRFESERRIGFGMAEG